MKAIILIFCIFASVRAQVASSSLSGVITDPSSSVVAGASVTAAQASTGFSYSSVTDARGLYVFDPLPPGTYTITARKPGFQDFEAAGVALEVNQHGRQDIRLTVGRAEERITVTASVSAVNADDASIGYRMDTSKIADLPLTARN